MKFTCRLPLAARSCWVLVSVLLLTGCGPQVSTLASGTWELDAASSREATLAQWLLESNVRWEQAAADWVNPNAQWVAGKRGELERTQNGYASEVERAVSGMRFTLEVQPGRRFVLSSHLPDLSGADSSGTYLLTDTGEVHLVRREVDGSALGEADRISGQLDDQGRIVLRWQDQWVLLLVHRG